MKRIKLNSEHELIYPIGNRLSTKLSQIREMADTLLSTIKELKLDSDTDIVLVCRGSSGSIIASSIITMINEDVPNEIWLSYVYKKDEPSHYRSCGGIGEGDYVILVDDFTATGNTVREIYKSLRNRTGREAPDCICMSQCCTSIFDEDYKAPKILISR